MFRDMPIKQRLVLGFGSVLALMAALALVVHMQMLEQRQLAYQISELNPQVQAANTLALAVDRQRTGIRGYITTGNERFHSEYLQGVKDQQQAMLELRNSMSDPTELAALASIEPLLAQLRQNAGHALDLIARGDRDAALALHQSAIRETAQEITGSANAIAADGLAQIESASQAFRSQSERLMAVTRSMFALALLLAVVFVLATVRSIVGPVGRVAIAAGGVARGQYDNAQALEAKYGGVDSSRNEIRQLAVAIAAMARDLEKRERSLQAHADIASVAASSLRLEKLTNDALAEMVQHTRSDVGAIYLRKGGNLLPSGVYGISPEEAQTALTGADGLVGESARSGRPIVLTDIPKDSQFVVNPGIGKLAPKSFACIPMVVEGRNIGVVALASLRGYDAEDTTLMASTAPQIGIAISNSLYHESVQQLVEELRVSNEQLDSQNEELQSQNEELQAQSEEIQAQSEEIQTQNEELQAQTTEIGQRNSELESATKDLEALQAITVVALLSLDQETLLKRMMETVADRLNLQFGLIMTFDEDSQVLRSAVGHNIPAGEEGKFELPLGEGFAGKVATSLRTMSTVDAQNEPLLTNPFIKKSGVKSLVGVPLAISDRLYGVAMLGSADSREFSVREQHLLEVFAVRCAVAMERAESFRSLQRAEALTRTERERLRMLIDNIPEAVLIADAVERCITIANKAATELTGVETLVGIPVEDYGKIFDILDTDGQPVPVHRLALVRSLQGETCSGVEITLKGTDGERVEVICNSVPVKGADGNITGAIGVYQDVSPIKEQQRLLQDVAETLQKSFLPSVRPKLPGYEIADAYVPAQEYSQVGGDFYDVIEIGDGRFGIVIADVSGKGVNAAVHTAMAKYMLRGFAHEDPEPCRVLSRLNDAITRSSHGELFITLFYAVLDSKESKLTYASAGHERPLLYRTGEQRCIALDSTGPVLGIIPEAEYTQHEETLEEGDSLVLYTDGITECRRDRDFLGQEGLEEIVIGLGSLGVHDMSTGILQGVRAYADGGLRDDVALLVVKAGNHSVESVEYGK